MAVLWSSKEEVMMVIMDWLMLWIPVLVNIAFFTLMERKFLGLSQSRKGPNKVSLGGVLQPFADAVKLFLKELTRPSKSNLGFYFTPLLSLMLCLMTWTIVPFLGYQHDLEFSGVFLIMMLSFNLYPIMLSGWFSNNKYALIGALRGVAQTISYEISLAVIILSLLLPSYNFSIQELVIFTNSSFFLFMPLLGVWLVSCVAETNRTPFDFSEGESELVSGFNIEYGGGLFAVIFMAEYGMIMVLSAFTAWFFGVSGTIMSYTMMTLMMCIIWVWLRATLPRFRYDMLMDMAWKSLLPFSLSYLMLVFMSSLLLHPSLNKL